MLGMPKYPKKYIDSCEKKINASIAAFKKAGKSLSKDFESTYFNNLILVLDHMFEHRLRKIEGKDGNPLNEVRVICNSLLLNEGKLQIDALPHWPNSAVSGLKLPVDKSVLKFEKGDAIQLSQSDFVKLADAFFKELKSKFL